jgi:hypothetical protein
VAPAASALRTQASSLPHPASLSQRATEAPHTIVELVLVAVAILIILALFLAYNDLVTRRNRTQAAWSEIDVNLSDGTTSSRTWSR